LRVNLAHFGGIWSFGELSLPPSEATGKDKQEANCWSKTIAAALENSAEKYPNLYVDTAYASILLVVAKSGTDRDLQKAADAYLKAQIAACPVLVKRMMYGSDWQMVGREEYERRYSEMIDDDITALLPCENHDDFRWRNAARFLGLRKRDSTYKRLAAFLEDDFVLRNFDPDA